MSSPSVYLQGQALNVAMSLQPRPQYREDSEEEDDDDEDDDNDEDYGGRRRGIDHASRPKRAAAKQAEQQLKAASVSL